MIDLIVQLQGENYTLHYEVIREWSFVTKRSLLDPEDGRDVLQKGREKREEDETGACETGPRTRA